LFFGNKETNRDEMILQNDFLGLSFTLRGVWFWPIATFQVALCGDQWSGRRDRAGRLGCDKTGKSMGPVQALMRMWHFNISYNDD
jgi:hypothetical protein